MRLKPEDLKLLSLLFHELTTRKYKMFFISADGIHEYDPISQPRHGLDELIMRSFLAAINTVVQRKNENLPVMIPETEKMVIKATTMLRPECNEYMWSLVTKLEQ